MSGEHARIRNLYIYIYIYIKKLKTGQQTFERNVINDIHFWRSHRVSWPHAGGSCISNV
jgi:hypothetical protein